MRQQRNGWGFKCAGLVACVAGVLAALPAGMKKLGTWNHAPPPDTGIPDSRACANVHPVGNPADSFAARSCFSSRHPSAI